MKLFYTLLFSITILAFNNTLAQDLTMVANAPTGLKIDGKLNEFTDSLTAYDKTTKLYYHVAHDEKNIYVFLKANKLTEQSKIMAGGVSISVNPTGKKKQLGIITFPVVDRNALMTEMRNRFSQGQRSGGGDATSRVEKTPEERQKERDDLRKATLAKLKEIKIEGIKEITEEKISIYNTYGIKTGINYDLKNALIYEIAIPLALLNLTGNEEFALNIKLNGIEIPEGGFGGGGGYGGGGYGGGGGGFGGGGGGGGQRSGGGGVDYMSLLSPTEIWLKAKLTK
jgi:hypothetical protein